MVPMTSSWPSWPIRRWCSLPGVADGFEVDLDDQRAGGVDGEQPAPARLVADLRRDAVGAVEQGGAVRELRRATRRRRCPLAKPVDDELVVDDLVIDVQRRPEEIEGPLQALDRHVDARAEAAGIGQDDLHRDGPCPGRPGQPRLIVCRSDRSRGVKPSHGMHRSRKRRVQAPSRRGCDAVARCDRGSRLLETAIESLLQFQSRLSRAYPRQCGGPVVMNQASERLCDGRRWSSA